jgi:hypothetical protein
MYSGKPKKFMKKFDQYTVSQVQNRKDHDIVVKKHFEHNYFSFRSVSESYFVKMYGLKKGNRIF